MSFLAFEDMERKSAANHIYLYRGLETEVHRVLHLEEDMSTFGQPDVDTWICDIRNRLDIWYEKAQSYAKYSMLEFRHVQFHHLRARIHRPTPRLRVRTPDDRRNVLESSTILINDYTSQVRRRRLFYPWHGAHILFEAAVIALEACWSSRGWLPLKQQAEQMLNEGMIKCLQALTYISKSWNEAAVCADRLAPLREKIASAFSNRDFMMISAYDERSITAEIQGLLFSDGPLTWNQGPYEDNQWGLDDHLLMFDNTTFDDAQFLQWDPGWDFMLRNTDDASVSLNWDENIPAEL